MLFELQEGFEILQKILKPLIFLNYKIVSGAKEDRTPDLLNAIQALSQLSYSPMKLIEIISKNIQVNSLSQSAELSVFFHYSRL